MEEKANTDYKVIAQNYFHKELLPDEIVHHIDGNHQNNKPENLVIMKRSQHLKLHGSLYNGLKEWGKRKNDKEVCYNCFFVGIYESELLKDKNRDDILFDTIDCMYGDKIKREKKFLEVIYKESKEFKIRNKHDCYEGKNKGIVLSKEQAFYLRRKEQGWPTELCIYNPKLDRSLTD